MVDNNNSLSSYWKLGYQQGIAIGHYSCSTALLLSWCFLYFSVLRALFFSSLFLITHLSFNLFILIWYLFLMQFCYHDQSMSITFRNSVGYFCFVSCLQSSSFVMISVQLIFNMWRKYLFTKHCNFIYITFYLFYSESFRSVGKIDFSLIKCFSSVFMNIIFAFHMLYSWINICVKDGNVSRMFNSTFISSPIISYPESNQSNSSHWHLFL